MVTSVIPNFTVDVPRVAPKPVPVMVTRVPGVPERGESLVMRGVTLKAAPLEVSPTTVTTIFTAPAEPAGTLHMIWVSDQDK